MGKFLKFERMITPVIIQIIFWLGFIASIIVGVLMMIGGIGGDGLFGGVFMGLIIMITGPIAVRIYCEILIVAFKILGLLVDIRDKIVENGGSLSPPPAAPVPTPPLAPTPAPAQPRQQVAPAPMPTQQPSRAQRTQPTPTHAGAQPQPHTPGSGHSSTQQQEYRQQRPSQPHQQQRPAQHQQRSAQQQQSRQQRPPQPAPQQHAPQTQPLPQQRQQENKNVRDDTEGLF